MKFTPRLICSALFLLIAIAYVCFTSYRRSKTRKIIDETLSSAYWVSRFKEFQAQPRSTGRIVFLGNSLTEQFDLRILGDSTIINRGITGDFTEGIIRRISEIISLKPGKLFIEIGINDLVEKVSVKEICHNYRKIIEQFKKESGTTKLFVQSVLPVRMKSSFLTSSESVNQTILELNESLKLLAKQEEITYIDLHSTFVLNYEINPRLTWDGVHLVDEGYLIWKGLVTPYLK